MADVLFMQFDTLTPVTDPAVRPKVGTKYLYQWSNGSKKNDWRADSYHWSQNGPRSVQLRKCRE